MTALVGPGVYETKDGIWIVKPNQAKTRCYAKRLVDINGERLTEVGEHVQFDFVYDPGAIYNLKAEDKMGLERGKQLTVRYGRCICCGRRLKAATSVERGIGPVCVTYFG